MRVKGKDCDYLRRVLTMKAGCFLDESEITCSEITCSRFLDLYK